MSSSNNSSPASEISHLKKSLRAALRTRGAALLSAVHDVLVALSAGVDVGAVYAEMLQAIEIETNRDMRQTRLVYLYLSAVPAPQPEFALLLVNSLHKHAKNASPVLRHEAVRTLAAVVGHVDYAQFVAPVLNRALDDSHPLVRRGATLSALVAALQMRPADAARADLQAALTLLVEDRDDSVALSALLALCQLLGAEFVPSHATLLRLLAAATMAHEFARAYVAELVLRVRDCTDEQRLELLNALDVQLEHSEACVVASAASAMLHLCRGSELLPSVCNRLIGPLTTLIAHPANPASLFVAMHQLALVLPHAQQSDAVDLNLLYIRYTDEAFVQIEKARLLAVAATVATTATCVEYIASALRVVEATAIVDALLAALVQIALKPAQDVNAIADIRGRLQRACVVGSAANRNVAVIRCAQLLRAQPTYADERTLSAMTEYTLTLNRDALCALLETVASVGPVPADCAALLAEILTMIGNDTALGSDSELIVQLLHATMRCFADGGVPYSRVAIETLELCLASDDARVRQRAELYGALLAKGKNQLRTAVQHIDAPIAHEQPNVSEMNNAAAFVN